MFGVDNYAAVRRFVFIEGHSRREAARVFGLSRETVLKMCRFSLPPGYTRKVPAAKPKLGALLPVIDTILEGDRTGPVKQRHTAKRIFERLRDEHAFAGGYTVVKDYVRICRARGCETFVPLAHPPGHGQVDFGEAVAVIGGVRQKIHFFCLDLPQSDACFVKAYPRETPRHLRLGVPRRPCGGVRVLWRRAAVVALRQHHDRGGEDLRRRQARAHPGVHRTGQPLPVCRSLWPPGQGERPSLILAARSRGW